MNIIKPKLGTPLNINHPLSRGLINCLILNEGSGSIAHDATGNINGAISVFDWVPEGLNNTGTNNQIISLPASFAMLDGGTAFTVVAKIRSADLSADNGIFYTESHSGDDPLLFWIDNAGTDHFAAYLNTSGGDTGSSYSSFVPAQDTDYIVALTWNGSTARLYINGQEDTGADFPIAIGGTLDLTSTNYSWANDDALNKELLGTFYYGMLYNRALDKSEVNILFKNHFIMFYHTPIWMFDYTAEVGVGRPLPQRVFTGPFAGPFGGPF